MSLFDKNFFESMKKRMVEFEKFMNEFEEVFTTDSSSCPKPDDLNYTYACEKKEDDTFITTNETWISKTGNKRFYRSNTTFREQETKESIKQKIKEAVEKEDYSLAAELKKKLDSLK